MTHAQACDALVAIGRRYRASEITGTEWATEVKRIIAAAYPDARGLDAAPRDVRNISAHADRMSTPTGIQPLAAA